MTSVLSICNHTCPLLFCGAVNLIQLTQAIVAVLRSEPTISPMAGEFYEATSFLHLLFMARCIGNWISLLVGARRRHRCHHWPGSRLERSSCGGRDRDHLRSEEHTSELQSLRH